MESIYKVCILDGDGDVKREIVFSNQTLENQSQSPFNEVETRFIQENQIPVQYAKQTIHPDDSIYTIKYKILKELQASESSSASVSYHELYLFSHIQRVHLLRILENLLGKTGTISKDEYKQLLVNLGVYDNVLEKIEHKKEIYSLDDMTELTHLLNDKSRFYKMSIGKRFRNTHNEFFSANPFDMFSIPGKPELWTQSSSNPLESFENQLLLNNNGARFLDNTIFVCFAEDVFSYCEKNEISTIWAASIYFPLLAREGINNQEDLTTEHRKLLSETKKKSPHSNESIDTLYDIYTKRMSDMTFLERGISEFSLLIHPEFKHILPLDIIFKNVHATLNIPFIKYNPGPRRENLYRLYSEAITKYGTKIPFLSPKTIIKLAKETGRNKQISFSVEHSKGDIYIHILNNGDISISGNNFRDPISISEIEILIQEVANPVIDHINDFLKKNGYELGRFENLRQSDVEIEYLHWVIKKRLTKDTEWAKYNGLFQSVLVSDDESPDFHKGAEFRYKRVENYSNMNEEDAYISGLFHYPREEVVQQISRKYELNLQEAALRLAKFLRDHEQQHGRFIQTSMKVSDSPGFSVSIHIESYENTFVCDFLLDSSIADIQLEYVDAFSIYMDSLLRISQEPKTTAVALKTIHKIGAKKVVGEKEGFENIVTGIETNPLYDILEDGEEDDSEEPNEISAFGNLDKYESVDFEPDVIEEYESAPEFQEIEGPYESLSSIGSEKESAIGSEKESAIESEKSIQRPRSESESSGSDSGSGSGSGSDSENSLMMMGEEEEEEEEEPQNKGGAPDKLDGTILKEGNNNLFLSKLKKKEPMLFLSEDEGKFSAYSKVCQASRYRQPVILTTEEKKEIDETDKQNGSKSYSHSLDYGTDPDKQYHYICPRYWCLKTNKPISEKDAKSGKCGKILPTGSKQVKPGHYVIEFNHKEQHLDKDGKYIENSPGFLDKKLHPKGLCMPCCFKKAWDSKAQSDRRKECQGKDEMNDEPPTEKNKKKWNLKQEMYIIDMRRYPLPQKRLGFLPLSVQYFLQSDNSKSVDKNNNKFLRTDKPTSTLLRQGVENSSKKSFIACIADLYASTLNTTNIRETPTIQEMCMKIASAVSIDQFLSYHNGSLPSIFRPKIVDLDTIDPVSYEDSQFMKSLDQTNERHLDFINDTIASYENFREFLKNENSYIDYTYLWDIICSPNLELFPKGCNLAILRIRNVDMTDDIELLCPTSVYSSTLFDIRKQTLILIQHDEFFEPVYLFNSKMEKGKPISSIERIFLEKNSPIKDVLQMIRNSIQRFCPPKSSMPKVYKFVRSLPATNLRLLLLENNFPINAQIINYHGKIVGLWAQNKYKTKGIYIPCYPSPPLPEIPVKFMDDPILWMNYRDTVNILRKVYETSKGKIQCRPVFKIMEDDQIIGVLTETNQFIMISDPIDPIEDDIPTIKDENYLIADKILSQTKTPDPLREQTIKKIKLETQFYSAFRTTVRILLNDPVNISYKQQIVKIIENQSKRELLETLIHTMCEPYVTFRDFDVDVLNEFTEISDCFLNPEEKKYCILQNDRYQLILPRIHLVSGQTNANLYFARISDELWRYKRIQLFMLNAKTYLNLTNTEYRINANEMLLLESLLTSDYLKSLEPYQHGNTLITYETANPILTQKYGNEISYADQQDMIKKDKTNVNLEHQIRIECVKNTLDIKGNKATSEWKRFFPDNAQEMLLHKTVNCSYYPIIYAYFEMNQSFLTIAQIKTKLASEYLKYDGYRGDKILSILEKQGKKKMIDDIRKGKYNLDTVIVTDVYYLTLLDLWVLANYLKLPIILFHINKLKHLVDNVNWLRLAEGPKYIFIRASTETDLPSNYLPQYNIVKTEVMATSAPMVNLLQNAQMDSIIDILDYFDR